jgi:hypothetical protein
MSAPASNQSGAIGLRDDLSTSSFGVIDAGVSSGETYSLMPTAQTEFWT